MIKKNTNKKFKNIIKKFSDMNIFVTRPSVPKNSDFNFYLKEIYKTRMLTTNGKLVKRLENKLKKKLGLKYLLVTCNGTAAIEIAIKTLKIKKDVLVSPFSYISTPNACNWLGHKVHFCDIDKKSFSINIKNIQKKTLKQIDCIMPTHVFGIASDIDKICNFAKKNKKKIIFDAAHSFGIKYKKKSVLSYGDASILSFQATKIFNTCEGGAVILKNKKDYIRAKRLINIGYDYSKPNTNPSAGINAKMSELNAAWGLALLKKYNQILRKKKIKYFYYIQSLNNKNLIINKKFPNNYNYLPILLKNKLIKNKIIKILNKSNIYPRKYFYPSLNLISHLKYKKMKTAENISERILCLPIYEDINNYIIKKICNIINSYE